MQRQLRRTRYFLHWSKTSSSYWQPQVKHSGDYEKNHKHDHYPVLNCKPAQQICYNLLSDRFTPRPLGISFLPYPFRKHPTKQKPPTVKWLSPPSPKLFCQIKQIEVQSEDATFLTFSHQNVITGGMPTGFGVVHPFYGLIFIFTDALYWRDVKCMRNGSFQLRNLEWSRF